MVKPVAAINTVVRLRFSSSLCSFKLSVVSVDQVADLSLSRLFDFGVYAPRSDPPYNIGKQLTVPSFLHVCVQSGVRCSQSHQYH